MLDKAPPEGAGKSVIQTGERRSSTVDGLHRRVEQILKRPGAGQMHAHTAGGLTNAVAEFEELSTQSFKLGITPGRVNTGGRSCPGCRRHRAGAGGRRWQGSDDN
jgi:hypothetical protein